MRTPPGVNLRLWLTCAREELRPPFSIRSKRGCFGRWKCLRRGQNSDYYCTVLRFFSRKIPPYLLSLLPHGTVRELLKRAFSEGRAHTVHRRRQFVFSRILCWSSAVCSSCKSLGTGDLHTKNICIGKVSPPFLILDPCTLRPCVSRNFTPV